VIEMAWQFIDPIIENWLGPKAPPMATYAHGSWGPEAANALLAQDGRTWLHGCNHTAAEAEQ
jgi:glucose-6-phosphate 1-dehydrogenase